MTKGCIYYTHNILDRRIFRTVQKYIEKSGLPIVSVSLQPIDFGENIVLNCEPGAVTMTKQILTALEVSQSDIVFFCEHDVLYHPSHFGFIPERGDTFYFNTNVWRWDYPKDRFVRYTGLRSLSGMCCYRKLALEYYRKKMDLIEKNHWENRRDPDWVRRIGYEPGKTIKRGGFREDLTDNWNSLYPLIDIRHSGTVTMPKVTLQSFKHPPKDWFETTMDRIEGWDLNNLWI